MSDHVDVAQSPARRSSEHGTPIRHKVAVACDECRARKSKCDGIRPVCQPCRRKQGPAARCRWTSRFAGNSDAARDHIRYLESRIEDLARRELHQETSSRAQEGNLESLTAAPSQLATEPVEDGAANTPNARATPAKRKRSPSYVDDPLLDFSGVAPLSSRHAGLSRLEEESNAREVNAMMGAMPDGPHEQGIFGTSSAANFIKQVKRIIDAKVQSPNAVREENSDIGNEDPFASRLDRKRQRVVPAERQVGLDYVLPTRKTADSLMRLYWELVHPLYPFVDREGICTVYESLWQSHGPIYDEPDDLCALNIIFALACQLSPNIKLEQRKAAAEVYFRRARHLLNYDMWQAGSFQLVQILLIFGQYLQSSDSPHQCWMIIGLAVRTAQSLGLHLPETSAQIRSPRRQQLARRVWYGCVLMDTILSMTYGRPTMIESRAVTIVPLPLAVDEQYLPQDTRVPSIQPKDQPATMAFYVQALLLNKILHDILRAFYKPSADVDTDVYETWFRTELNQSGERSFLELDRALTLWSNSLPFHLVAGKMNGNEIYLRQANILRQRFLHTRILLYRPILSRLISSAGTDCSNVVYPLKNTLLQRMAVQCAILCVQSAQAAIENIRSQLAPEPGLMGPLPAWWYLVFYVYTSATVLLAARLRSFITAEITQHSLDQSWTHALEILRRYESCSTSAKRCVAVLEVLFDRVPQDFERQRQGQAERRKDDAGGHGQREAALTQTDTVRVGTPQADLTPFPVPEMQPLSPAAAAPPGPDTTSGAWDFTLTDDILSFGDLGSSFTATDMSWLDSFPPSL